MPISDEDLIAYLLGDANPQQRKHIETGLAEDEDLRGRICELRMLLGQLDTLQVNHEPPADLFATTMARIDEVSKQVPNEATNLPERNQHPVQLASRLSINSENRVQRGSWDSTALVACGAILLCLFIPTVLRARFESRRAQCAYRLSYLGRGLVELASMDPQQRFPAVALDGPQSFAGIFAVRLNDAGFINSPSQLRCASLEGCRPNVGNLDCIPTTSQLNSYDLPKIELCRTAVGGDYAYSLGLDEDGTIVAARCEGRTNFAVLADAPLIQNDREEFAAHDGLGMNIFFEDGHVAFVVPERLRDEIGDNPFCNIKHAREVGLNSHDASLGPSHFRPFGND